MSEWADEPREPSPAERREERHDLWEALNKALNTLMLGHAAGLVTCLTLMKDYKENSQLEGLGTFIALFGVWTGCCGHFRNGLGSRTR